MINVDYVNCLTLLCATPPSPIPGDIETLQTTKANGVTPLWPCIEQSQARKMVQQQSNSGLGLKAGQRGTQTVMDPHSKGEMTILPPWDIEVIWITEGFRVPVA